MQTFRNLGVNGDDVTLTSRDLSGSIENVCDCVYHRCRFPGIFVPFKIMSFLTSRDNIESIK